MPINITGKFQPSDQAHGFDLYDWIDIDPNSATGLTAGHVLTATSATAFAFQALPAVAAHDLLGSATHTDTLTGSPILGDLIHGNGTPKWARLAGQITTTRKFLRQTGDGAISGVPVWDTLLTADVPGLSGTNSGDQTITLTGDVTGSGTGSFAATIANDAVTLAKMANMATASFLGRNTAATGDPEVLSIATSKTMLNLTGTNSGDQTITLTGDVTGSGTGSFVATIANDAVAYAKIQNVSATDKLLGRSTAGAGDVEEITCTSFARTILDDTTAAAVRTTIGAGTVTSVGVLGGSTGLTTSGGPITTAGDITLAGTLVVANGGTGLTGVTGAGRLLVAASATTIGVSAILGSNELVVGGGTSSPQSLGGLGTTTTVLHGNAGGPPSFSAVALGADVSGQLPIANGGTGQVTAGAATNALTTGIQFVTMAASSGLDSERVLTAGTGISLADGGAGSTATLAIDQAFTPTWTGKHIWSTGAVAGDALELTVNALIAAGTLSSPDIIVRGRSFDTVPHQAVWKIFTLVNTNAGAATFTFQYGLDPGTYATKLGIESAGTLVLGAQATATAHAVQAARLISAGTGLTGGGDLTADRTISMPATGTPGTYTKVATDSQGRVTSGTTLIDSDLPTHVLATSSALGAQHTVSGLTTGHVLTALSATTAAFQALPAATTHDHSSAGQGGSTLVPATLRATSPTLVPITIAPSDISSEKLMAWYDGVGNALGFISSVGGLVAPTCSVGPATGPYNIIKNGATATSKFAVLPDIEGFVVMVGNGTDPAVAGFIATVNRTGRTFNIGVGGGTPTTPVILANATAAGFYLVSGYLECSAISSDVLQLNVTYTDSVGAKTQLVAPLSMTSTANAGSGVKLVYLASGNITWTVTGYTSGTYNVRIRCTYLGS